MTEPSDPDPRAGLVRDSDPSSAARGGRPSDPEQAVEAGRGSDPTPNSDAEIEQGFDLVSAQAGREVEPAAAFHSRVPDDASEAPTAPSSAFRADRIEEDADRAATERREAGGPRFQWPLVLVLIGLVVSLVIVATDHFRRGSVLFAACVVLAFFLRAILSDRDAGWLAVRSRPVDLLTLAFLGLSLSVFALIVPPPS